MKSLPFQIDAFTDKVFGGNQRRSPLNGSQRAVQKKLRWITSRPPLFGDKIKLPYQVVHQP
jgi:hypothetical protein